MMTRTIIFTDLDGTLLDADTYSFQEALPALDRVRSLRIPLILVSSKTRAEIEVYRRRLENDAPFITENGGGLFVPAGYFPFAVPGEERDGYIMRCLGMPYAESRRVLDDLRRRTGTDVRGFGDLSPDQIAGLTGLSREEAVLAKQRDFSEPFVFSGPADPSFLRAIEEAGLHWTQGRLFHLMGDHDKGRAAALLRIQFERLGGPVTSIGLGDGLNDLPLLQVVDRPVLVREKDGSFDPRVKVPRMQKTEGRGPSGWNEAVLRLLADR